MAIKHKSASASLPPAAAIKADVARLTVNYHFGQRLKRDTAPDTAELQRDAAKYPGGVGYSNRQKMRQLANKITATNWSELMKLRWKRTGLPLTWAHLVALASAPAAELMPAAEQAAHEGWSADNLRRHLQRAAGTGSRRPGTGRKIGVPGSVVEGLQQLLVDLAVVRQRVAALRKLLVNQAGPSRLADDLTVLERAVEAIRTTGETGPFGSVAGSRLIEPR